jgi:hypothetical protein
MKRPSAAVTESISRSVALLETFMGDIGRSPSLRTSASSRKRSKDGAQSPSSPVRQMAVSALISIRHIAAQETSSMIKLRNAGVAPCLCTTVVNLMRRVMFKWMHAYMPQISALVQAVRTVTFSKTSKPLNMRRTLFSNSATEVTVKHALKSDGLRSEPGLCTSGL